MSKPLTATVRIDPSPMAKHFQGVWLELPDGKRWLVDYRSRPLWEPFRDEQVNVTGAFYAVDAKFQSVNAQHFRVDRMAFVTPPKQSPPYLEIGPVTTLKGQFEDRAWPAGSKLAGSTRKLFVDEAGNEYVVADTGETHPTMGPSWSGRRMVRARPLVVNPAYSSTSSGAHLWIVSVHGIADPVPEDEGTVTPCP
ncbi:MAG TPA: hypothetical protein VFQ53_14015 [Kofleriaceae bacterium]|nr:hypothetical protein [Kofleriaceae bacterium]